MNWDERRPLNLALSDRKKNGRAAKMLSVLRDGQPHDRAEIFKRVGYMLTNNAASELRRELEPLGYGVAQWCVRENSQNIYVYQLVNTKIGTEPAPLTSADSQKKAGGSLPCGPEVTSPSGRHPSFATYEGTFDPETVEIERIADGEFRAKFAVKAAPKQLEIWSVA